MLSLLFAVLGLLVGGLINMLADDLPLRERVKPPHCASCGQAHRPTGWLALGRLLFYRGRCPVCATPVGARPVLVEIITPLLFAYLPLAIDDLPTLIFVALYAAILLLIIVIDLEHHLILHVVTFPTTALALVGSFFVSYTNIWLALLGAVTGFLIFLFFFWIGQSLFGPGALGFGDVTLSMTMGAMLGFPYILFALIIGILLGGVISLVLLLSRLRSRHSYIAYGPFLALGGLVMVIWGPIIFRWYMS